MAEAYDEDGVPIVGSPGELVITKPMPSMPIGFWGDPTGDRFRATYFNRFPGVWWHGDRFLATDHGPIRSSVDRMQPESRRSSSRNR